MTALVSSMWPGSAGRTGRDRLERHGHGSRGQAGQDRGIGHVAADRHQGQARDDPEPAVQAAGDGLGAVDGGGQDGIGVGDRQDRLEQPPADPPRLLLRAHEAHRQEPQAFATDGGGEGDHPALALGDHEQARVGREEVPVEADDPAEVVGDRVLVQPAGVVVDALAPDLGTGLDVGGSRRPDGDVGHESGSAAESASSPPPVARPVARRSSSACMNVSRSPSRTALVLLVSTFVRRSLTIW